MLFVFSVPIVRTRDESQKYACPVDYSFPCAMHHYISVLYSLLMASSVEQAVTRHSPVLPHCFHCNRPDNCLINCSQLLAFLLLSLKHALSFRVLIMPRLTHVSPLHYSPSHVLPLIYLFIFAQDMLQRITNVKN
jgi:hypothetical protein